MSSSRLHECDTVTRPWKNCISKYEFPVLPPRSESASFPALTLNKTPAPPPLAPPAPPNPFLLHHLLLSLLSPLLSPPLLSDAHATPAATAASTGSLLVGEFASEGVRSNLPQRYRDGCDVSGCEVSGWQRVKGAAWWTRCRVQNVACGARATLAVHCLGFSVQRLGFRV